MKRLTIVWGGILIAIFIALTTFGFYYSKTRAYKNLEKDLVDAAKKYVEISFAYPKDDEKLLISKKDFQDKDLIKDLKASGKACDGYAIITKNEVAYEYKGYIKCSKYETENYEEYNHN